MGIIAALRTKGKTLMDKVTDGVLTALVVVLACSASFGLGILTGQDTREGELRFEELTLIEGIPTSQAAAVAAPATMPAGGQYVASRTGKSYHLPWCSGAKQIKEENKVWFATKEAAEAAGYAAAKNCKGL